MKRVISLITAIVIVVTAFSCGLGVSATEDTTPNASESASSSASESSQVVESESNESQESQETNNSQESQESDASQESKETEPAESSSESESTQPSSESEPTESTAPSVTESTEPTKAPVKKPKAVSSFKVIKKSDDFIKLEWKKSKEADKYLLYRAVENKKGKYEYKLYKTVKKKNSTYVDRKVESGKIYKYRIFVVRVDKKKDVKSKSKSVACFTPMVATANLKVKSSSAKAISMAWNKIKNAEKYEIYKKADDGSAYKKVATTSKTSYKDVKLTEGTIYTYKVRGYRVANGTKRYSPFKVVSASAGSFGIKSIKTKSYLYRGLFTWNPVQNVEGYEVYQCKENGEEVLKETVTGTSYLTGRLKKGKTYTYSFKPFKKFGGEKVYGKSREAKVKIVSTAYGKSAGKNYIEVCLETQTVNMVIKGKQYLKTPVVTGMYNVYDTTRGFHRIISKKSPARLRGSAGGSSWDVNVKYWLGFTWDGEGLHDSTWRTSGYGGSVYKGNGSHGCVNTPYTAMGKIYKKAYGGMPVIVY